MSGLAGATSAVLCWRWTSLDVGHILALLAWLVVVQGGVLLSMVDLTVQRLPTPMVAATGSAVSVCIAGAALFAHQPMWIAAAGVGAAAVGGAYLLLALFTFSQIGMGDVRVAAVLGAPLGMGGWDRTALGVILAYVAAVPFALMRLTSTAPGQRRPLPFGPFLIAGAVIAAAVIPG